MKCVQKHFLKEIYVHSQVCVYVQGTLNQTLKQGQDLLMHCLHCHVM